MKVHFISLSIILLELTKQIQQLSKTNSILLIYPLFAQIDSFPLPSGSLFSFQPSLTRSSITQPSKSYSQFYKYISEAKQSTISSMKPYSFSNTFSSILSSYKKETEKMDSQTYSSFQQSLLTFQVYFYFLKNSCSKRSSSSITPERISQSISKKTMYFLLYNHHI